MSQSEIYTIAKVARAKLVCEASFKDHNLHRLVTHANLYDVLLAAYYEYDPKTDAGVEIRAHSHSSGRVQCSVPPFLMRKEGTSAGGFRPGSTPITSKVGLCEEDKSRCQGTELYQAGNPKVSVQEVKSFDSDD